MTPSRNNAMQAEAPSDTGLISEQSMDTFMRVVSDHVDRYAYVGDHNYSITQKSRVAVRAALAHMASASANDATQPTASNAGEREAWKPVVLSGPCHHICWMPDEETPEERVKVVLISAADYDRACAALATKPPAGEQKPVGFMSAKQLPLIADPGAEGGVYIPMRKTPAGLLTLALYTAPQPEQVAQDSAVLAFLDDLKDDAIAHIWPDDLERCQTSECVVEVTSVRMGSPDGKKTVPLFSREQVAEALRAARTRGEQGGAV